MLTKDAAEKDPEISLIILKPQFPQQARVLPSQTN